DERQFRLDVTNWRDDITGPFRVVSVERINGIRRIVVALDGDGRLNDVLGAVMSQGCVIHGCDRVEPDLEEAFARLLDAEPPKGQAGGVALPRSGRSSR